MFNSTPSGSRGRSFAFSSSAPLQRSPATPANIPLQRMSAAPAIRGEPRWRTRTFADVTPFGRQTQPRVSISETSYIDASDDDTMHFNSFYVHQVSGVEDVIKLARNHNKRIFEFFSLDDEKLRNIYSGALNTEANTEGFERELEYNELVHLTIYTGMRRFKERINYAIKMNLEFYRYVSPEDPDCLLKKNLITLLTAQVHSADIVRGVRKPSEVAERLYKDLVKSGFEHAKYYLGSYLLDVEMVDSGIAFLEEAVAESEKNFIIIKLLQGYIKYRPIEKKNDIERFYEKLRSLDINKIYLVMAKYYEEKVHDYDKALEAYQQGIEKGDNNAYIFYAHLVAKINFIAPNRENTAITSDDYYRIIYQGCLAGDDFCKRACKSINAYTIMDVLKGFAEKGVIKHEDHKNEHFIFTKKEFVYVFVSQLFEKAETTPTTDGDEPDSKKAKECEDPTCTVCIEKDHVMETKCGHHICEKCIPQLEHFNCPMCREPLIVLNELAL
jgi:tetratricopeptide (TPR) repeat protein